MNLKEPYHIGHHREGGFCLLHQINDPVLCPLGVPVISHEEALAHREETHQSSVSKSCLGLDRLHGAWIPFLGHDGTSCAMLIAQTNHIKFAGGQKDQCLCHCREMVHHHGDGVPQFCLRLPSLGDGIGDILRWTINAEKL